jgi:hypothetical protein
MALTLLWWTSWPPQADNEQMRTEIVRLENVLAGRIAARANQDKSNLPLERSSKIEKYVEVMELTKCLRRQKEFLLSENRKRQRFAEKIQQAMPVRGEGDW